MLFDLRARGRRRTVQIVYLGLAGLMALGLVGFGIGGGFGGGGIFEGLTKNEGSNGATYAAQVEAASKRVHKHPTEVAAWAALTEAQLHEAGGGGYYNSTTGAYTSKGKEELHKAANSWAKYLQLNPDHPSPKIALEMATVFSPEGLNEPANAVQALQIVIPSKEPSAALYSSLAQYAYLAHNIRQGDLASTKALALAPKSRRPLMELEFERMKKAATEKSGSAAASGSSAAGSSSSTTGSASSTTVTTTSSTASKKK